MLLQVRDYICREGVVSTQQLTREFRMDLSALQPMLDLWVDKGAISPCQEKTKCQSACFKCQVQAPVYYQAVKTMECEDGTSMCNDTLSDRFFC